MQFVKMAFHRCYGGYPIVHIMRQEKEKKSATKKTTNITVFLTLMTITVIDINNKVACWPLVESPSPRPWSTPSSSSSLPPPLPSSLPLLSTNDELDSDASRKVLGSSVVTSVSVVMNSSHGKSNASTTPTPALEAASTINNSMVSITTGIAKPSSIDDNSRMDGAELKSNLIASPGNLLNPDKYEFYTFDEAGDLVKRLMSWEEIQGLIAASDTDSLLSEAVVPIYYTENVSHNGNGNSNSISNTIISNKLHDTQLTANEFQTSDIQDVRKVVESVQNVLKSELAAAASSKSKIIPIAVKPSSLHSNPPNWSSLFLPNFLENLDEAAFVDLQQHHQHPSSNDAITTKPPLQHSTFDTFSSPTFANTTSTVVNLQSVPHISTFTISPIPTLVNNYISEKDVYTTQSNDVALKNSIMASSTQKFTRIKNTATKPTNFKHSSSTTSERVWSSPNLLVSNEKPTKNFTINSYQPSAPSSSPFPQPLALSSPLPSPAVSIHAHQSSMMSSWPVKSYSTKNLTTETALKSTASTSDRTTATIVDTATVKTATMLASANESSTVLQQVSTVTTNRDSFTTPLTNLLNPANSNQQQTSKFTPIVDTSVYNSSKSSTEVTMLNLGQRHTTILNSISTPLVNNEKYNMTSQPSSWSLTLRNSTDKSTIYQHQYSYNGNVENMTKNPSLLHKQSQSPAPETNSYLNTINWMSNGNGVSDSTVTIPTFTPPGTAKFNQFSSYWTATATNVATLSHTTSTNNVLSSLKVRGGQNQSTTAEPLVTWISTNNFGNQQLENKKFNNGQILDSDKLVTEQYVSGTAPMTASTTITHEHLVSSSKNKINSGIISDSLVSSPSQSMYGTTITQPFTKKTTVSDTFGDGKTNIYTNSKIPAAITFTTLSSPHHTRLSTTTTEPSNNFIQQPTYSHRVNIINNNASSNNVESKTVSSNSNNHFPYHHFHQHHHLYQQNYQQQPNVNPNHISSSTFNSYYHRPDNAGTGVSSTTITDTTNLKYTKNPPLLFNTTSNEMVMQRIPTLDPPNKILSTFITNGSGSNTIETNQSPIDHYSTQNSLWTTTKSALHHSSTESVKNLTQIAVLVNKFNDTQVPMIKNSFNKNALEMKNKLTTKPNRIVTPSSSSHHFFDSTNNYHSSNKHNINNNNNEDKMQPTVKPINVEFLNDCITSLISNSMGSAGGSSSDSSNNDHETWHSLSHNINIANASHNYPQHYNVHHIEDKDGKNNYVSTASNYSNFFSRDQNKYSSSVTGAAPGTMHAANTLDSLQHKLTMSSATVASAGEKQKENSHIYYYKLPPINSQPMKANANTPGVHLSSLSTGSTYSPMMTWPTTRPNSTITAPTTTDKIYQKITTVDRSPLSSSTLNLATNELMDLNHNIRKQNVFGISTTTASSSFQSLLHTEARVNSGSSASTTSVENTFITLNTEDAISTVNLENREASEVTVNQISNTKSSSFGQFLQNSTKFGGHDENSNNTGTHNATLKSTTATNISETTGPDNVSATTKHTEHIATPQLVVTSLNISAISETKIEPTTPIAADEELSDLRKEYSQHNDDVSIVISNDGSDDDNDDDDGIDDINNDNVGDSDDEKEEVAEEQIVKGGDNEQSHRENDHSYKGNDITLTTKNQRVSNATVTQFGQFNRKTSLSEVSLKDRIRTNVVNRNFTTSNPERHDIKVTSSSQKNGNFYSTTLKPGDVNITSEGNILGAIASSSTTPTLSDDSVEFVRVKLENHTTQTLNDSSTTNKQKDEKIKVILTKNQPAKQNGAVLITTTAVVNTSSPPMTNSVSSFRSPVATSTLIRPPSSTSGANSVSISNTVAPIVAITTTAPRTTNGNSNSNVAPTVVELHPAPHENMGLEASVAYLGDDVKTFIDLCNELSFKIWTSQTVKSLTTSRSIVLSPFALLSTLAMIFLGARGSSSGIMNDFLRLDDMVTFNPHQVFRNITESAINSKNTGAANVAFVRQVFSDKTKGNVLEFYKERLQQYYDTYVEEINFNVIGDLLRRRTNLLVKRQTQGRIQDYLRGSAIAMKPPLATFTANIFQTDCSIASTEGRDGEMYFVVRPSTRQRRLVPIPAVVYRGGFLAGYEPGLDATAVTLSPESIISTILVLPGQQGQVAPGDGLARLEQRLLESSYRRGAWSRLLRSLLFRHGLEVQIPRFSHKSILNLTMGLQKMGMGEIFAPDKADLRGINGLLNELHLSDCVQANTFSTCGEESVGARHHVETFPSFAQRAGAVLARQIGNHVLSELDRQTLPVPIFTTPLNSRPRQARLPDNPRLRFDRPFLYIVRHNPTGMILFIGRFNPRLLP